ncbi:hypothetical protein ACQPXT_13450 [Streptomyces sp. CA-100214]
MPNPSSPFGALLYALIAAALIAGFKWAYGKVQALDLTSPTGMITAVIIGVVSAVVIVGLAIWVWQNVSVA